METSCTIAVDVMSGDHGPHVTIPASLDFLLDYPDTRLQLVGEPSVIERLIAETELRECCDVVAADTVVSMADKPSFALRHRQGSSMYRTIEQVASGRAAGAVSAGNTGALMAMGRYLLHTHPGIDRPAIATSIPTQTGRSFMLDLGANVDCSAEHLCQFALLGAALVEGLEGVARPRVALLNIGEEATKGNEQVRLAARLLAEHGSLNYVGFVEGDGVFKGRADVVVCDGFVGNVALKSSEGLARLISLQLGKTFRRSWYARMVSLLARPLLRDFSSMLDPSRHNGASLLGLRGVLVKSHGAANRRCFRHALEQARFEIVHDVPALTNEKLASLL